MKSKRTVDSREKKDAEKKQIFKVFLEKKDENILRVCTLRNKMFKK